MKIAVVGNGPSAELHAAAIGAADKVVRCNAYAPPDARCDIWASHFDDEVLAKAREIGMDLDRPRVLWLAMSPAADRVLRPGMGLYANAVSVARRRPVRQLTDASWVELISEIGERRPSTGLVALRMALDLCPREIILAGFDATAPGAPGWGSRLWSWDREPARTCAHDFGNEKLAIQRLVETGIFCGARWETRVAWLRLEGA